MSGSIWFQLDIWPLFTIRFQFSLLEVKKRIVKPDDLLLLRIYYFGDYSLTSTQLTALLHPVFKPGHHKLRFAACDSTHATVWLSKSN